MVVLTPLSLVKLVMCNHQDGGGERRGLVWSSHKPWPWRPQCERERERDLEVKGFKDKNVIQLKK